MPRPTCRDHALRGHSQKPGNQQRSKVPSTIQYVCCTQTGRKGVCAHMYILQPTPRTHLRSFHLQPTGQLQATIIGTLNYFDGLLTDVPIFTPAYVILLATEQPVSRSYTSDLNIPLLEIILEPCLYLIPNNCEKAFLKHLRKD